MRLNNLTAEMTESDSISIMRENGEEIYKNAMPYMYDANG